MTEVTIPTVSTPTASTPAVTVPKATSWKDWCIPLAVESMTLREILDSAAQFHAGQEDIPLIVRLIENPSFDIPGITLFNGAVDLKTHDCIHAVLGRGMLAKDEAFVIGFTMGSTNRVSTTEERLFSLISKHLYPKHYKFADEEIHVFKDAVRLGFISDCTPLSEVDFELYMDMPIGDVRRALGVEAELIKAYYQIEKKRYPQDVTSARII